ncbi:DUF4397 domain-containing protein [Sutcliffiella deserti]|uniref:DUF4397 domain-containing protein n=1 Tax=Sutcliffiella deserti TaxID=2875501 RepID=UPI001CBB0974|nr:DUF4397 domain-containing protein [Sutcliffiella deserti]
MSAYKEFYERLISYQIKADIYKYKNPEKHLYFYQKQYMALYHHWMNTNTRNHKPIEYGKLRFLHAAPDSPALDVYINNELVHRDFHYTNSSMYIKIPYGTYHIYITLKEDSSNSILSKTIEIRENLSCTLAVVGLKESLDLISVSDDEFVPPGESKIRVLHLSPNTPSLDIAVLKGDVLFSQLAFSEVTDYLPLTPMTVDLELRIAGTKEVILPLRRVNVKPNTSYTIIATGLLNQTPNLEPVFLIP